MYFWVNGVQVGVPVRARTQGRAKARARKLLERALGGTMPGLSAAFMVDEETEESNNL